MKRDRDTETKAMAIIGLAWAGASRAEQTPEQAFRWARVETLLEGAWRTLDALREQEALRDDLYLLWEVASARVLQCLGNRTLAPTEFEPEQEREFQAWCSEQGRGE